MVGLGQFTTHERMKRTSRPEVEYTGRPSLDGEVIGREGGGHWEGTYKIELD